MIIAEYAGATCTQLKDMDFLNRIRTLYETLEIPLDPHAENWSTDLRMLDIFEDECDDIDLHIRASLKKVAGCDEEFKRFFGQPADLSVEELKQTDWGKMLNPSSKSSAAAGLAQ